MVSVTSNNSEGNVKHQHFGVVKNNCNFNACLYEQSMRLSCRFLQIKEVNQKLRQITFIRLKTRHFRTKKMYDADTKSLIFQGYVVTRCPILRYDVLQQTILTRTYWWHHLLSNGGNLFVLLYIILVFQTSSCILFVSHVMLMTVLLIHLLLSPGTLL